MKLISRHRKHKRVTGNSKLDKPEQGRLGESDFFSSVKEEKCQCNLSWFLQGFDTDFAGSVKSDWGDMDWRDEQSVSRDLFAVSAGSSQDSQGLNRSQESANKWHSPKFRWGWDSCSKALGDGTMTVPHWMAFPGWAGRLESRVPSTGTSNTASWEWAAGVHQARFIQPGELKTKEKSICCLQLSVRNRGEDTDSSWRKGKDLQIQNLTTDTQLHSQEKGFHTGLVKHWSIWLKKAVKSPPVQVFQNSAGLGPEQHDVVLKWDLLWAGGWARWPPEVLPTQIILWCCEKTSVWMLVSH